MTWLVYVIGMTFCAGGWAHLIWGWFLGGGQEARHRADLLGGVGGVLLALSGLLWHWSWWATAICAANGALALWLWWRKRRRRDRTPRTYGAKSRALIAALVARAREAGRPRVLRPVPGGAR